MVTGVGLVVGHSDLQNMHYRVITNVRTNLKSMVCEWTVWNQDGLWFCYLHWILGRNK